MRKILNSLLTKSLVVLAIALLIITSLMLPALADDEIPIDGGGGMFVGPVLPPATENPCASGHDLHGVVIQDATCLQGGVTCYTCSRCNYYEEKGNDPAALGHQRDGGSQISNPTCTDNGVIQYRCVRCGADMGTDQISALGHQPDSGTSISNPTCTDNGIIQYRCVRCGADMGTNQTPPLGHESDNGTIVRQPTTTVPGEIEYKCKRCGIVLREEAIPVIGKRELPQAVFSTDNCALSNIPDNSTVKINGTVISNNAAGILDLRGQFPQVGDYTIVVIANGDGTKAESEPQSIHTNKPIAPSHLQSVDEPAQGGMGAIGGVDTSMEYSLQEPVNWIMCTSSSQPVTSGIYIVRYKATATSIASDAMEVLVKKAEKEKPATPNASFDGPTHQLRNLIAGMVYSTNGGDTWTKVSDATVTLSNDAVAQAISYKSIKVKNIVQGVESDVQTVAVGRVAQPTGISTKPATNGNNGTIEGVGTDMQYVKDGSNAWIDIGSNKVSGLQKGKYYVRRKATGNLVESNPVAVIVDDKQQSSKEGTPSAMFNAYNMHIDGVSGCRLSFDGGYNWTDRISDTTYIINESYLNTKNGIIVYRPGNGSTTSDSDRQYITLTKQPTPSGISATSATSTVPGCIVGTDVTMQYRAVNQATWIDVTGATIPVIPGTYYLRRHGYGNALPSDWLTIVIKASTVVEPTAPKDVVPVNNTTPKNEDKKDVKPEEKQEEKPSETTEVVVENEKTNNSNEPVSANGEVGWDAIEVTFEAAVNPVVVALNEATLVPADVFVKAAETNTPLVLSAQGGAEWSILPSDVNVSEVNSLQGINLGIVEDSVNIPVEKLAELEDASKNQVINKTFDIKHEGNFGFKAELTMKVNGATPGEYANLYTYNPYSGNLEFIDSSIVSTDGKATFKMSHASSYVIVTSKEAMSQDSIEEIKVEEVTKSDAVTDTTTAAATTNTTESAKEKKSPVALIVIIVIIILLVVGLVFVVMKKKQIEEKKKHHKYH